MRRYREHRVRSVKELRNLIDGLDLDEGIRIVGDLNGFLHGGFIFIVKSRGRYCVNFCDRLLDKKLGGYVPGGREEFHYAALPEEVWAIVKDKFASPLKAVTY